MPNILPFNDNSMDLVVCRFGYMFVTDKPKVFAEAYRVLKSGGMFLFTPGRDLENNAASWICQNYSKGIFGRTVARVMQRILRPR